MTVFTGCFFITVDYHENQGLLFSVVMLLMVMVIVILLLGVLFLLFKANGWLAVRYCLLA